MAALFEPFKLKAVSLRNRIAIPPMCRYQAVNGVINEWHYVHYAGLARGGAGLVIVEATAVSPEGRITPACAGLWTDEQAQTFAPVVAPIAERVRRQAALPVCSAWGIDTPELAQRAVASGQLDLVLVGRVHLANPHWPYHAARRLGVERPSWILPAPYAHWLENYAVG